MRLRKNISIAFLMLLVMAAAAAESPAAEKETKKYPGASEGTASYGVPQLPKLPPRIPTAGYYSQVPAKPSVVEIQKELQQIVQIHRSLQAQHQAEIAEIQRITEQAKAHQKLLMKLSTAPPSPTAQTRDIDEVIRLQKIRLIQEQARKNRAALEEIQKQKAGEEGSGESSGEPGEEKAPPPSAAKDSPKKKTTFWW